MTTTVIKLCNCSHRHVTITLLFMTAGDARNEVPITNVAKIEFPGSPRKKPPSKDEVAGDVNSLIHSLSLD